jgi:uncharacterized protein (TIGR02391 family)
MVKRQTAEPRKQAQLSPEQMKAAIPVLERRLKELEGVDFNNIQERSDPALKALEKKIDSSLADIFGNDTADYFRYTVRLDKGPMSFGHKTPIQEVRDGFRKGINQAVSNLKTIIELFKEKLGDLGGTPVGKALKALGELELHPEIEQAAGDLFRNGHYANAIEDACKALDTLVKLRSKQNDFSGTSLMQKVFSPNNPILKFNELKSQSEKDEQHGMMLLYSGAMLALRNPRAHEIIKDNPELALEYIAFISLLAKCLNKTKRS